MIKVWYENELLGEFFTNKSMTEFESLRWIGMDVHILDDKFGGDDGLADLDLLRIEYG